MPLLFNMQISGEFPELLSIKESLIKYVFEPNAAKVSYNLSTLRKRTPSNNNLSSRAHQPTSGQTGMDGSPSFRMWAAYSGV